MLDGVICGDCMETIKGLPDGCIDLLVADPPYGMGLDVWDIKQDIPAFTKEAKRILNPRGFYAFFGQMPYILDWCNEAQKAFKYREHISWVKRMINPSIRLSRGHEEIMIYSTDNAKFYETSGKYEDVKTPGIMFDVISIETIKQYISSLRGTDMERFKSTSRNPIYNRFPDSGFRTPERCGFTNVWSFLPEIHAKPRYQKDYSHPTMKPILLMERLIEMLTLPDMLVLSPFLGSGTDAVACINTNRHWIGIELSETYCQVAEKRISQAKINKAEHDRQLTFEAVEV